MKKVTDMSEYLADKAGESLDKIDSIMARATEELSEEDLQIFLERAQEILQPLADKFKQKAEK